MNATGNYVLLTTTPLGACTLSDSLFVEEMPLPTINPETPVFLCLDSTVTLDAGAGWEEILWSGNLTTQTINIDSPGNYTLTVTQNSCNNSTTFEVTEVNLPAIELESDQVICSGNQIEIDAGIPIEWNMRLMASLIFVGIEGTYSCIFEEQGCSVQDAVYIEVQQPPVVLLTADTKICEGKTTLIESNYIGVWSHKNPQPSCAGFPWQVLHPLQ
jgi:hypothetical protein